MSDQYAPSTTKTTLQGVDPTRSSIRIDTTPPAAPRDTGSGFGTGMLVALVFAIVAILAAAFYSNRDAIAPVSVIPSVVIENNATPEAGVTAPDTVAPESVAPLAVEPAPDAGAPAAAAPVNP